MEFQNIENILNDKENIKPDFLLKNLKLLKNIEWIEEYYGFIKDDIQNINAEIKRILEEMMTIASTLLTNMSEIDKFYD